MIHDRPTDNPTLRPDPAGFHSSETMIQIINRERARVDRRGGRLVLVLFDLHPGDEATGELLIWATLRRKRETDEAGWLGESGVALALPDTNSRGAQAVIQDIGKMVRAPISYRIYSYPTEDSGENGDRRPATTTRGRESKMQSQEVLDLQSLLQQKVPSWKRTVDVIASLSGLLLTSPLFAAIALYIKIVSPGPAFYRQERLGKGRRRFQLLKFRSMHPDADSSVHKQHLAGLLESDVPMTKLDCSNDCRIIPLGNLLRWSCLDELPQLINVLRGDMSLVGPRPCLPYEAERYLLWQTRRFDTLPGITGLWQVSGKNRLTFKQMIRLDIRYGRHPSLWQDIRIMLRTPSTMLGLVIEALKVRAGLQALHQGPQEEGVRQG